jgi:formylglycine-generating enzyme required for sulfatase activity
VFTTALLKGLAGAAKSADGKVRLSTLTAYVQKSVAEWGQRSGLHQTPKLLGSADEDIELLMPLTEPVVSISVADQPLAEVVKQLADQCGAQIVLGPGVDPAARVTGRLDGRPLSATLKALVMAHRLTVRRDGDLFIIEGAGGEAQPAVAPPVALPGPAVLPPANPPVAPPVTPAIAGPAGLPAGWPDYLKRWTGQMPTGLTYRISPKDGMPQVLIPAGEFLMGSPDGQGNEDEHPQRRVRLSAYWMDAHDVTVAQFRRFCADTGRKMPTQPSGNQDNHPVVSVNCEEAASYARWAGRQLPTEAQWERADRGGVEGRVFPWGDVFDFTKVPPAEPTMPPVGSAPPNGFGLFDMAGTVFQVCRDWYDAKWYARMPDQDPVNTTATGRLVVRGGITDPNTLRAAFRLSGRAGDSGPNCGFRCAEPAESTSVPAAAPVAPPPSAPAATTLGPSQAWPAYLEKWRDQMPKDMHFRIRAKDGMPQVLIPAGVFVMGSPDDVGDKVEHPQRRIFLSAYWIDLHHVTVAQYRRFCAATGRQMPSPPPWGWLENHPMVMVHWAEAAAYAQWVGGRLPSVAQFEKASRGGVSTTFPWGDEWDQSKGNGPYPPAQQTNAPGTYPPNGYGLFDMNGNAWEWMRDCWDEHWYAHMPAVDPVNEPMPPTLHVKRGGSYNYSAFGCRAAFFGLGENTERLPSDGFRCIGGT